MTTPDKLEEGLKECLKLVDYLEIASEEKQARLRKLASELSLRIRKQFGEIPIWYLSNRIVRAIDDAKITKGEAEK